MTLQPTDQIHTAPPGVHRSTWQCSIVSALVLALTGAVATAEASTSQNQHRSWVSTTSGEFWSSHSRSRA